MHRLVAPRDQKYQSNFVEFRTHKIVYRRYAGLFFCACVDTNDNELAYLEAIHFFVEVLDAFFGNVCELDIIFSFTKAYYILDELLLAGELQESSKKNVPRCISQQDSLEDMEVRTIMQIQTAWKSPCDQADPHCFVMKLPLEASRTLPVSCFFSSPG